jgi:hypothetical protein
MPELVMHNNCMNRLSASERARIIAALVEGNSLRSTSRMCDVAFNTVLKVVPEIGTVCTEYHDRYVRNVRSRRIQCDEIWLLFLGCLTHIVVGLQLIPDFGVGSQHGGKTR